MDPSTSQTPNLTDEQLLAMYQGGEIRAFEMLVRRYRQELFHFLARFTGDRVAADDIFQDAFLQVHLSANTFDADRRFKPWLFTIAANKARDYLRKVNRRSMAELSAPIGMNSEEGNFFIDLLEADLPMPSDRLEREELEGLVKETIRSMPEHLKEIMLLSYFHRFSYNQISEILEIPLGTVKSRLHTAVGTFAIQWKKQNFLV